MKSTLPHIGKTHENAAKMAPGRLQLDLERLIETRLQLTASSGGGFKLDPGISEFA